MPAPQPTAERYPQIEPDDQGLLDVGDGNLVYWETCGNPDGKAALVLHGGPGSGCTPGLRRYFDPAVYRIVLFDQRGCGRSRPHASDPAVSLAANTTGHLIADIEALRAHLGIGRWLVFGSSWGTTLALAYAERHPGRVSELVLAAVVGTAVRREVEWITRDMQRHFPAEWARFAAGVPAAERDGSLAAAYSRLLNHRDEAVRVRAASDWCAWEDTHVSVDPRDRHNPRYDDPAFRMVFARMVTHYWSNDCFLEEGALLRDAGALAGIPGVLAHGRLDVSSPIDVPWQLAQVWPDSELVIIGDAAHTGSATMTGVIVAATDRFAADG
jgi:proline iminopeptidase